MKKFNQKITIVFGHKVNANGIKFEWTDTQVRQIVKQFAKNEGLEAYTLTQGRGFWGNSQEHSTIITVFVDKNDTENPQGEACARIHLKVKQFLMQAEAVLSIEKITGASY